MEIGNHEHKSGSNQGFGLWKADFESTFKASRAESFRDKLRVVSEALYPQTLDNIHDWNPKIAREIASYLSQDYPDELKAWTQDRMSLFEFEENKRVRQLVAVARKLLSLKKV